MCERPLSEWPVPTGWTRVPVVRWGVLGQKVRTPVARLNTSASMLIADLIAGERAGIRIRQGVGEDAGKFALEVLPYVKRGLADEDHKTIMKVTIHRKNVNFRPVALMQLQNRGQSILYREGNFLIGTLGDHDGIGDPLSLEEVGWLAAGTWMDSRRNKDAQERGWNIQEACEISRVIRKTRPKTRPKKVPRPTHSVFDPVTRRFAKKERIPEILAEREKPNNTSS